MMSVIKTITAKKKKPKASKIKKKGGGIGNMFRHSKGRDKLIGFIDSGACVISYRRILGYQTDSSN